MLNMLGDTESQGEDGSRRNEGGARQPAHTSLYLPRRLSHLAHLSSLHVIEIPNNIFEADTYGFVHLDSLPHSLVTHIPSPAVLHP